MTVGTAALDRAPEWARSKLFGQTIPALRFYRVDEPRKYINGRELYGRPALIVLWGLRSGDRSEADVAGTKELQLFYAQLQRDSYALQEAGVDVYFVHIGRAHEWFRHAARRHADPGPDGYLPIFALSSSPNDGNTLGIMGGAADVREMLFGGTALIVLDRRGIVRFHAREFPAGPRDTLAGAVDFALHALPDVPAAPEALARAPADARDG